MRKKSALFIKVIASTCLILMSSLLINVLPASAVSINVVSGADGITVNGQCQLSEAIGNINDQAQTNVDCPAGDGNNDTIVLAPGTINLTADLPELTQPVNIVGNGKSTTTIDAAGFMGFVGDFELSDTLLFDFTFQNFTITNADYAAIYMNQPKSVTLNSVDVTQSGSGAILSGTTVTVMNSDITNNTSTLNLSTLGLPVPGSFAGLVIIALASAPTDVPTVSISNSKVSNNYADSAGIYQIMGTQSNTGDVESVSASISQTSVLGNQGNVAAGISIFEQNGPTATVPMELRVDSVTVANNSVTALSPNPITNGLFEAQPYSAGMGINGMLAEAQNFTNLTATNNTVTNLFDDQPSLAGFTAVLNSEGADLSIINATITNNIVTQTEPGPIFSSAVASGNNIGFYALKLDHSNFAFLRAATSQNSIVAGNARNGNLGSCAVFDTAAFGLAGTVDLTPTDLGGNITDDINCTDYRLEPNILSTLGPLQDNGGIVPTIALLDGSPAIGAAVQVLGISVDARGVARPSSPDVGAYQTVFVSSDNSITSPTGVGGTLPETGKTSTTLVLQALLMLLLGLAAVSSSKKMHTIGESKSVKVLN